MLMYCMKCKKKTHSKNLVKKAMGGKIHVKGFCAVCNTGKSTFAKK